MSSIFIYPPTNGQGGAGSSVNLPISANDVTETPNKVYVTSNQRAQIESNTLENVSQTNRISNLENTLSSIVTTDEKVKMNSLGEANYLQELLDGVTVVNSNGKLTVQGINNLIASINELNFLQGATGNIQQQINNISGVSTFRGVFSSLPELQSAPSPQAGEYAIVSENGMSNYYFYYGNNWDFSHSSVGVTNVDINSNTTGILSKSRYEKQNASETPFLDASGNIKSTNTNQAILEVFQFADSLLKELTKTVGSPLSVNDKLEVNIANFKIWWSNLADTITNKGVVTSVTNNGLEIINKIKNIPNVNIEGTLKKISKINATSPYDLKVILDQPLPLENICSTIFEYVKGDVGVVKYDVKFDNGDKLDFIENKFIKFDGTASLQKEYNYELEVVSEWSNGGIMQKIKFNRNDFDNINNFDFI